MIRPAACPRPAPALAVLAPALALATSPSEARPRGPLAESLPSLTGSALDQVSVGALAVSLDRGDDRPRRHEHAQRHAAHERE